MILKLPLKAIFFFSASLIFANNVNAQTLFSFDNEKVLKEEFLSAYNKNKTQNESEKSFKEYLDLYINYKLKVKEAKSLRIDTLEQITTDIQNFRKQLQEGFLIDEDATTKLLNEALSRGERNVHVIHFFSSIKDILDSTKANNAINVAYNELKKGRVDYNKIALEASAIYPVKYSDAGFITVFSVPYNFENIIYNLNVGETSLPYKTSSGLHIFKAIQSRPDIGKWKIAQILIATDPEASMQQINAAKQKADSVYSLLKGGLDFGIAA
ncbi:MAG: peptidylprolyl isomerase, partial [Ferruginibacter sp.]